MRQESRGVALGIRRLTQHSSRASFLTARETVSSGKTQSPNGSAPAWQRHLALVFVAQCIALGIVAASAIVLSAIDVFCLLFLGIVFAVFIHQCGVWTGHQLKVGANGGIAIVVALLFSVAVGGMTITGGILAGKVRESADEFESAVAETRDVLREYPVIESAVRGVPGLSEILSEDGEAATNEVQDSKGSSGSESEPTETSQRGTDSALPNTLPIGEFVSSGVGKQAASVGGKALVGLFDLFATTFGALTSLAVIVFIGLFLAIDPDLYVNGLAALAPESRRQTFVKLCGRLGQALWAWLLGRFGTMAITGAGVWAVMAMLGVPLPFLLGLFTALMVFIPNIGAVIAVSLAVLLALPKGITTVALVVVAYTAFQLIEGYILTPIIQKRAVQLPPALLISGQLVLGVLFGFLGVMVATPLVAVAIVLIQRVYVEDDFDLFGRDGSTRLAN